MTISRFDVIIVGQGLAGTALAWALRWRGHRVLIVDRENSVTSSRVAAGLMTPITGQRLVKSWRWDQFWASAMTFYSRVEAETNSAVFHPANIVRLLASERENDFFNKRRVTEFKGLIAQPESLVDADWFDAPLGGFEMQQGGRLDVGTYLTVSRKTFMEERSYIPGEISTDCDLELTDSEVQLPRLGVTGRRIIFCQGIDAMSNAWFSGVQFNPAKGEILTLRIPGLTEQRIVHRGVWLMPIGGDLFRAGATYDWKRLDCYPTHEGRDEICSRLREFLKLPFEVVGHAAAVRPILYHLNPIVGLHPEYPQLGFLNGLGSKGSLQGPWVAEHFAGFLDGEHPLDPDVDLQRRVEAAS